MSLVPRFSTSMSVSFSFRFSISCGSSLSASAVATETVSQLGRERRNREMSSSFIKYLKNTTTWRIL